MQLEGAFTHDAVGIVMTQLRVETVRTADAQFSVSAFLGRVQVLKFDLYQACDTR